MVRYKNECGTEKRRYICPFAMQIIKGSTDFVQSNKLLIVSSRKCQVNCFSQFCLGREKSISCFKKKSRL